MSLRMGWTIKAFARIGEGRKDLSAPALGQITRS